MNEFFCFGVGALMALFAGWIVLEAGNVSELRACAETHDVFKCEKVITYVPVVKGN